MEYDSAIERNEILIHAIIWINFEDIMEKIKKPDTKSYMQ